MKKSLFTILLLCSVGLLSCNAATDAKSTSDTSADVSENATSAAVDSGESVTNEQTTEAETASDKSEDEKENTDTEALNGANGYYFCLSESELSQALSYELVRYGQTNGQKTNPFNAMTATFYLALHEHYNSGSAQIQDRVIEQLSTLVSGGHEPDMDVGAQWSFGDCAAAVAMAKLTPSIWSRLSEDDIERLDFLMQVFAYVGTMATDDNNNYTTTLAMYGNYNKEWNPNYRFTNVVPMLAVGVYFGGAKAVDDILLSFDYDEMIEKVDEYKFSNMRIVLSGSHKHSRVGTDFMKKWMEEGGRAKDYGRGVGVKTEYTYHKHTLDQSNLILNDLLEFNYQGGKVVSSVKGSSGKVVAYIEQNKVSPYEGMNGMMTELLAGDAGGVRSSASYSMADLNLSTVALTLLMTNGSYRPEVDMDKTLMNKVWVGNNDLVFKLRNGYYGYSNGQASEMFKYSTYGAQPQIFDIWENCLMDKYIKYIEPQCSVEYTMQDGTVKTALSEKSKIVLSEEIDEGFVWYDGEKYYQPGAEYVFDGEVETLKLSAVSATGIEGVAYHLGHKRDKNENDSHVQERCNLFLQAFGGDFGQAVDCSNNRVGGG